MEYEKINEYLIDQLGAGWNSNGGLSAIIDPCVKRMYLGPWNIFFRSPPAKPPPLNCDPEAEKDADTIVKNIANVLMTGELDFSSPEVAPALKTVSFLKTAPASVLHILFRRHKRLVGVNTLTYMSPALSENQIYAVVALRWLHR